MALLAAAGADIIPSDMIDGRIAISQKIRTTVMKTQFCLYSKPPASSFYAPFRDALYIPGFGYNEFC